MNMAQLMDMPRIFTALAEWAACLVYILLLKKRISGIRLAAGSALMLGLLILLQYLAGLLPLWLWLAGMLAAAVVMYLNILLLCVLSPGDALYLCVRAFVLAEFTASLGWQFYVWLAVHTGRTGILASCTVMSAVYAAVFTVCLNLEKRHLPKDEELYVNRREMLASSSIALSAFLMSNLSFVIKDSPFSTAAGSILYVRTLVDFGGLVMLFAQQDKREEMRMRNENQAMNVVLQRQYEQYQLARSNMEFLKREFHDLKHYMIAIRSEQDPEKREHYLSEMENAIRMQEALTDTGNSVLDVMLTTKSAYCLQHGITFSCMANGRLLDFMDVKDICSIFGNALDNAIECVVKNEDPQKRLVNLSMFTQGRFLMIQFENYSEKELILENSLPRTTKENRSLHGYGLKSIRQAASNYGGTMTLHHNNSWFTLQVLIPLK